MKKLNRKFVKVMNFVFGGFLSMLGFTSCKEAPDEYGTPYAEYIVKGKVVNEGGQPLDEIRVVMSEVESINRSFGCCTPDTYIYKHLISDTIYTSPDGKFDYKFTSMPEDTVRIKMLFDDVSANSVYVSDSVKIDFLVSELSDGGGWNKGSATKEVNVKLKSKKQDEK